jgi:Transposase protein
LQKLEEQNLAIQAENALLRTRQDDQDAKQQALQEKLETAEMKLENIHTALKKHLSKAQIDRLLYNKNTNWSADDYATGVLLLGVSKKFYNYLRSQTKFLLPCVTSVKSFVSSIDFEPGLLKNALTLLNYTGKKLTALEKCVVLSYDEMHLHETCGHDTKWDQVLGPCRQVQVIHARGLYGHWKCPVFYDFDVPVTQELLQKVISALYEIDFQVVATVSDLAKTNEALLKRMGVTIEKPFFFNKSNGEPVFCFHDAPHNLKLCRNHLLDSGIDLSPGAKPRMFASKDALLELVEKCAGIDVLSQKMTLAHLHVKGSDRQNVLKATQTLSASSSRALLKGLQQGYLQSPNCEVL